MNEIIQVKNLIKRFGSKEGGFTAVDDISFSVKEGEIMGLLGPNGAGKTTTIQMLLAVLTPTSGDIEYFGKKLKTHREKILEEVNFSTTYTNLPWFLTVKENFTFISYLYEIPKRKERINEILNLFKLEELANRKMSDLSAGQRTRVNLAKAFLNKPKVLLLDEPTASLDPDIANYIRNIIINYRSETNATIIWTSHNMAEVDEMCDRVVFIDGGKIKAIDTPSNLAGSIKLSHIELLIKDGMKRTEEFCKKNNFKYKLNRRTIIIDVTENKIAEFLRDLMATGVIYDEISIDKPTLEDYFLQVASKYEVT